MGLCNSWPLARYGMQDPHCWGIHKHSKTSLLTFLQLEQETAEYFIYSQTHSRLALTHLTSQVDDYLKNTDNCDNSGK